MTQLNLSLSISMTIREMNLSSDPYMNHLKAVVYTGKGETDDFSRLQCPDAKYSFRIKYNILIC